MYRFKHMYFKSGLWPWGITHCYVVTGATISRKRKTMGHHPERRKKWVPDCLGPG